MGWYRVIKTIKGHRYAYLQRSWREGQRVRTESRYLGPADGVGSEDASPDPAPPDHTPVITTKTARIPSALVRRTFRDLTRPLQEKPSGVLPFEGDRRGKNLVKKNQLIEQVIAGLAPKITHDRKGASYRPSEDCINIPPMIAFAAVGNEAATEGYYSTLLHELAHWTGAERRLKRRGIVSSHGFMTYAREELVAEGATIILMRHFGATPNDLLEHANYFQTWLAVAGDRQEALAYAEEEATKAANFILRVITT